MSGGKLFHAAGLIFLIALIVRLIFFSRALFAALTHIFLVAFFNLFVFHLQA